MKHLHNNQLHNNHYTIMFFIMIYRDCYRQ